ncbi:hypothetical protein [Turicibacter sanguinis]|uniref:hypothetical protein n=1 Tax=Turicibacter sanguinis TaxID=154288 RepID=UPI00294319A4|nr:hypothetical protein [Turicibacter sanguinis]
MAQSENIKTSHEIGLLVGKLTTNNQVYVMNIINALLFSHQTQKMNNNITRN